MTSTLATLAAILASLAGIALLTASDPKRRRVFGLPEARRRPVALAGLLILAPGIALLTAGQSAGFVMWLGAVPLVGWALSARAPARAPAGSTRTGGQTGGQTGGGLKSAMRGRFRRSSAARER